MRVVFIPPNENEFRELLSPQSVDNILKVHGGGLSDIRTFTPAPRRRGGGIFSTIAKTIFPFLMKTVTPVAKEFGSSVLKDVFIDKRPLKSSLEDRGIGALKEVGKRVFNGSGRVRKRRRMQNKTIKNVYSLI